MSKTSKGDIPAHVKIYAESQMNIGHLMKLLGAMIHTSQWITTAIEGVRPFRITAKHREMLKTHLNAMLRAKRDIQDFNQATGKH